MTGAAQMTIKPVVYLLGLVFIAGANLSYSEEMLIFLEQQSVSILSTSLDGIPVRKEIIKDVYYFKIHGTGYFTMKNGSWYDGVWYKGRIDSSSNISKQTLPSIPSDAESVVVSKNGKRIAWQKGILGGELTIEEYNGDESKTLRKISTDGLIMSFSWSPNSNLLAYFGGPPEAAHKDGLSLMLLDVENPEKSPIEVAPPSLPTRLTPGRNAPSWSPTGEDIVFEARYKNEDTWLGSMYMVSINGQNLIPCESGLCVQARWYTHRLEPIGILGSGEYIIVEIDISSKEEKRNLGNKLKIDSISPIISPSGQKVAYIANKEIFVYDIAKKSTVSYGTSQSDGKFFWISPKY